MSDFDYLRPPATPHLGYGQRLAAELAAAVIVLAVMVAVSPVVAAEQAARGLLALARRVRGGAR